MASFFFRGRTPASEARADGPLADHPFRREDLLVRLGPFAVVAILAQLSLALPPGPTSNADTIWSSGLLALAIAGCLLRWERLPRWSTALVPLVYVASVLFLNLAAGGSTSGVGIVILIPLVWAALYDGPGQSVAVVLGVEAYELISSLYPTQLSAAVITRRLVFFLGLSWLVAYATLKLRARIAVMLDQRQDLIDQREQALVEMTHSVKLLEARDRESRLLIELGDTLQACADATEAYGVVARQGQQLFEGGALSVLHPNHAYLESVLRWGSTSLRGEVFSPEECWALRRGRAHVSDEARFACGHLDDWSSLRAICVPMIAQGETIGVFHVFAASPAAETPDPAAEAAWTNTTQLALAVGEHVGMAMANFRLRETLRGQSIRDPLTNLFNRRYLEETFERELARATRDAGELGVMQIDVDHFKRFNDDFGHDVGDALLRAFADLLIAEFRDSDVPCRYGGEEFTMILLNTSIEETERRAHALRRAAAGLTLPPGANGVAPAPPTLSIGVAAFPKDGATATALMRAADQALYAAKANGRDAVVRATASLTTLAPRSGSSDY